MSRPKIVIKSKSNPPSPTEKKTPDNTENRPIQEQLKSEETEAVGPVQGEHLVNELNTGFPWGLLLGLVAGVFLIVCALIYYFYFYEKSKIDTAMGNDDIEEVLGVKEIVRIEDYGGQYDDYEKDILSRATSFSELVNKIGIAGADINLLKKRIRGNNLSTLRKGDRYTVYYKNEAPELLLIEPKSNPYNKFEVNLSTLKVDKIAKKRELRIQEMAAIVETNLGVTFINNSLNLKLINKLEEIFEFSVDLFEVDDGDRFKILYEQEFLDGKPYVIRGVKAAYIREGNIDYYAFARKEGNIKEFYNEHGESLKRSFLSSPIKYGGVVTSGFGLRNIPLYGHEKMHFGTDYAAPEGTPIVAVADGVITIRATKEKNGNYIKMRHDRTFETQYLHLQKFHPNVKSGTKVRQGDVIGYVGMTGSASGPHVCYRFWKNGEQVSPKEGNVGVTKKVGNLEINDYLEIVSPLKTALKKIEYF